MKEHSFKNKTTVQLVSTLYLVKFITAALIFVVTLLLAITIYGMLTKENTSIFIALFAVAISCSAILPIQFISIRKIKTELKSR